MQLLAYSLLMMTSSYSVLITALVILGACSTVCAHVSVVYMYESLRKDHFTKTYTAITMIEGVLGLSAALYF